MAPFTYLLAISSLAILACSFGANPATALVTNHHHIRDVLPVHGHGAIAKRKRATATNGKRCKARPSSTPKTTPKPQSNSKGTPKNGSGSSSSVTTTITTTTTTKAVSTPYTAPKTSSGQGKVGLAWANGDDGTLKNFVTSKVKYIYTWSPHKPAGSDALGLEFMPMLWGDSQIGDFTNLVKKGYANIVLGMNEPNEHGQSYMDAKHGVELWQKYIEPLRYQGYQLISPATSSDPNGMVWVKEFVKLCGDGCHFDGVAVHWYDVNPADFITYLENWHDTFGKPIYATEFACQNYNKGKQCDAGQVENFVSTAIDFMEKTDWVVAYFPFGFMRDMRGVNTLNQLMSDNGQPNALGKQYLYS